MASWTFKDKKKTTTRPRLFLHQGGTRELRGGGGGGGRVLCGLSET